MFPDKSECCQLNLEFEESDKVVFSTVGLRTVHLTETKTERSDKSEESEYGGSSIDDDDPEFVSSSQEFSGEGRRKKKYQISESENEGSSQQMDFTSGIAATVEVLDSELEVTLPISSLSASKSGKADVKEIARKK
ncbi:hypothetical protein Godav_015450 [Gossypium davidsonii]|uniref:Nucleoplasmin-like domain-containing protein n=2 Tax=Gossypium TaxID=3633 RepID=A0A7J8RPP6_GOSDV|nr:hypothetical protein [Gossypium davidsonii]MBA0650508.1 hypothetical protein [Gossypium klotzschianum]